MFRRLTAALVVVAVSCAVGAVRADAQQSKLRVSIADAGITPFCLKMRMLRHPEFPRIREKHKLVFEEVMVNMSQGPVVVANRDIDIGECTGISTMVSAWNKGAKGLVVFSVGAIQPVYQIVVHPSIKSLQDLKGKHIGSPGPQTASTEAVEMVLKRGFGLLPSRDYDFVATGGGAARAAALVAGKIHAIPTFPPLSDDLEQRGMRVLGDMVDYVPLYVSGVDVVRKDWAEQNRDLMVRLIKAIVETGQWLKAPENKGAAIDWFAKNIKATEGKAIGEASATKMYDYYIATKKLSFDGYAPEQAVRSNLDILKERGLITDAEIPPLGQLFDFSYLNQALRELNLPQVAEYPK